MMTKDFLDASFRKKLIEDKVLRPLQIAQKATAQAAYSQLVENTPVDTGRAKSNWWMDINTISTVIREPDNGFSGQNQSLSVAAKNLKPDDTIFISNNLPYINPLNDGSSRQQPAGFVERAVQVGSARGKEAAKRIK